MGGAAADKWVLTLGFVLILSLSGLIAYVGDYIGRRIGRKRLTIFGLRPKNTAILFTVVTGMLISALATVTILLASEGARKRLLHYSETVSQLEAQATYQKQQRQQAEQFAEIARRQKDQAEQQLVTSQKAYATAETARREAETRSRQAVELAAQTQRRVEAARRELIAANARRLEAERRYRAAQSAARTASLSAELARRQLREAEQGLALAQRRYQEAARAEAQVKANLAEARTQLQNLQEETRRALAARDEALVKLTTANEQVAAASRILSGLSSQNTQLTNENDRIRSENQQLQTENGQLEQQRDRLRTALQDLTVQSLRGDFIVRNGAEVVRVRFPARMNRDDVEQRIRLLMANLETRAATMGAGTDPEHADRHAVLYGEDTRGALGASPSVVEMYVRRLIGHDRAVWVRAIALTNALKGQPIRYYLSFSLEGILYVRGDVIAFTTIDGAQPEPVIVRELEDLFRERVNKAAEEKGLLPNPEKAYTVVPPEKWLPALHAIKAAGKPVTVSVVAASTIRSGDPLDIDFRVTDESHG